MYCTSSFAASCMSWVLDIWDIKIFCITEQVILTFPSACKRAKTLYKPTENTHQSSIDKRFMLPSVKRTLQTSQKSKDPQMKDSRPSPLQETLFEKPILNWKLAQNVVPLFHWFRNKLGLLCIIQVLEKMRLLGQSSGEVKKGSYAKKLSFARDIIGVQCTVRGPHSEHQKKLFVPVAPNRLMQPLLAVAFLDDLL